MRSKNQDSLSRDKEEHKLPHESFSTFGNM